MFNFYNYFVSIGIYIIISKNVCVCVRPLIGSAPGHDRNMRPVSIEPYDLKWKLLKKIFPQRDQWPNNRSKMFDP
jgi:hypothetical protein